MTADDLLSTPAGRLALVLRTCKTADARSTQQKPIKVRAALEGLLDLAPNDNAGYFAAVAEIMSMPVAIRRDVAALENPVLPGSFMLRHIDLVESVLPLLGQPHQNLRQLNDRIGTEVIEGLEATSHVLAQSRREKVVPEEELQEIRALAIQIIDQLATDETLSASFREEIRRHAQSIIDAVNMYKVHGADGLRDEADALIGVYVRHVNEDPERRGEKPSTVLQSLRKLTGKILLAVTVFTAPYQIASSADAYSAVFELPESVQTPAEVIEDADVV